MFVSQCRIATESDCVFRALSTIRSADEIIERFANAAKTRIRRASWYVFEFASIFFSLIIHNYFDNLLSRSWTFDEIRTLFWSLTVRLTIAITQLISFFVFAIFVVALQCERIISFRWRIFLTREKRHVLNCSIYEQRKKSKIFFEFRYVFSKLSCFVCDWFIKWACSFIFFRMTKRMKTTFVFENKRWLMMIWFFWRFFFSCFCDFLIFFFDLQTLCIF